MTKILSAWIFSGFGIHEFYFWDDFRGVFQTAHTRKNQEEAHKRYQGKEQGCPVLWAAAKKYEEKHRAPEVRADEEMDAGV